MSDSFFNPKDESESTEFDEKKMFESSDQVDKGNRKYFVGFVLMILFIIVFAVIRAFVGKLL